MSNKNNNISQFDELFKQGLENHTVKAPAGVFEAVSSSAAAGASAAKIVVAKWLIGGLFAIGAASAIYYFTDTSNDIDQPVERVISENSGVEESLSDFTEQDLNGVELSEQKSNPSSTVSIGDNTSSGLVQTDELKTGDPLTKGDLNPQEIINTDPLKDYQLREKINYSNSNEKVHYISLLGNICAGSRFNLHLNTTESVEWYVNDEQLENTNARIDYQFLSKQPYSIEAYVKGVKVADTFIDMSGPKVTIRSTNLGSEVNELSAHTSGIKSAAWEFNGKVLSTDRKFAYDARLYKTVPVLVTTDKHGCKDTFEAINSGEEGKFKFIQTVLTPNGDGKNDDYEVMISGYETFTMIISDLNGKPIFTTNDPKIHWNGRNQITNLPCENGKYVVFVSYRLKNSTKEVKEYDKVLLTK